MQAFRTGSIALVAMLMLAVGGAWPTAQSTSRLRVLVDTDANNELDDQNALA